VILFARGISYSVGEISRPGRLVLFVRGCDLDISKTLSSRSELSGIRGIFSARIWNRLRKATVAGGWYSSSGCCIVAIHSQKLLRDSLSCQNQEASSIFDSPQRLCLRNRRYLADGPRAWAKKKLVSSRMRLKPALKFGESENPKASPDWLPYRSGT